MRLVAEGLSRSFGTRKVIGPLSFSLENGRVLGVAGENGSGKTTLLRVLAGLIRPSSGRVVFEEDGMSLAPRVASHALGWFAPDLALDGALTAAENLDFFAAVRGLRPDKGAAERWLLGVGLDPRRVADVPLRALSTGQRQRVKLAYATLHDPGVLLLDEPGANLDEAGRAVVQKVVASQRSRGIAILVLVGYAVGPTRLAPEDRPTVNAVLLWIVIFFSAMTGLSRVFVKEEEAGTASALRLAAPPPAILLGKYLVNILLLFAVMAFIVPLFLVLTSFEIKCPSLFIVLLVFGGLGLAGASTFTAALVSTAAAKGALFAVLSIPLLLPPLIAAVSGTQVAARETSFAAGLDFVRVLVAYDGVVTTAAFALFDAVWRE